MSTIKNGGPAFPAGYSRKQRPSHDPGGDWVEVDRVQPLHFGLSVRDYLAAKAMAVGYTRYWKGVDDLEAEGVTVQVPDDWRDSISRNAYLLADAMLRAREATP